MAYRLFRFKVRDYAKWREYYERSMPRRRAAGATGNDQLFRDLQDPSKLIFLAEWMDEEKALAWYGNGHQQQSQEENGMFDVEMQALERL